jgi:hypothetical protein
MEIVPETESTYPASLRSVLTAAIAGPAAATASANRAAEATATGAGAGSTVAHKPAAAA